MMIKSFFKTPFNTALKSLSRLYLPSPVYLLTQCQTNKLETLIQTSKINNLQKNYSSRVMSPASFAGLLCSDQAIVSGSKPPQRLTSHNTYNFGTQIKDQKINMRVLNVAFDLISLVSHQKYKKMIEYMKRS